MAAHCDNNQVLGFAATGSDLYSGAIVCAADSTLLAAGDTDGVVSAWDVPQSCLLSAAQVHEGYVSSCCWSSTSTNTPPASMGLNALANGSSGSSGKGVSLISCSYDGTISVLQVRFFAANQQYNPNHNTCKLAGQLLPDFGCNRRAHMMHALLKHAAVAHARLEHTAI